jgi:hypothetical protein
MRSLQWLARPRMLLMELSKKLAEEILLKEDVKTLLCGGLRPTSAT